MHRSQFLRAHVFFLLIAVLPLRAVEGEEAASASGTIEIGAKRPEERLAPQAGRTKLDEEDIAGSGAESVEDLLDILPGVSASDAGSEGAQSAPSIRGSTTNSVLVIVDGVPVSDPATGLTDFSRLGIGPDDIASIEVVKGGASAQWGPDASAGVIVIRTKGGRGKKPSFEVEASNLTRVPFSAKRGSGFDAVDVLPSALSLADSQVIALRAVLPGGFAIGVSGERASNAFSYIDANGIVRSRENADLMGADARASWDGEAFGGTFGVKASGSFRELGLPGAVTAPTPDDRQRDGRAQLSFLYGTDAFFSDAVAFSLSLHGLLHTTEYRPPAAEADFHAATRAGADAAWSIVFARALELGAGISGRYERLDSSAVLDASGSAPSRIGAGAYAEPRFTFGPVSLSPAARFDWASDYGGGASFSLGAALRCSESITTSLIASTAYRAPSFDDLYWPAEPGAAGNPGLSPERAYGGEARMDWKTPGASASVAVFARYVEDVILWQPDGEGIWRPSNWGEALYPGLEASASVQMGDYALTASWNFLRTYALSGDVGFEDDIRVPMVPEHSLDARFGYGSRALRWGAGISYAGLRYLKLANTDYLPSRLALSADLSLPLGRGLALELRGENILNERYESIEGYPMPGFNLKVSMKYAIGGEPPTQQGD